VKRELEADSMNEFPPLFMEETGRERKHMEDSVLEN
jgi:hypothetical protein